MSANRHLILRIIIKNPKVDLVRGSMPCSKVLFKYLRLNEVKPFIQIHHKLFPHKDRSGINHVCIVKKADKFTVDNRLLDEQFIAAYFRQTSASKRAFYVAANVGEIFG
jgi:hypothetical protein